MFYFILFAIVFPALPVTCIRTRHYDAGEKQIVDKHDFERDYHSREEPDDHYKQMMMSTMAALMKDARMKMREVIDIGKNYETLIAFNVGLVIGNIRELYFTMLEIHEEAHGLHQFRLYTPPSEVNASFTEQLIHYQTIIHQQELAIDQYVSVLESIPQSEFSKTAVHVSPMIMERNITEIRKKKKELAVHVFPASEENRTEKITESSKGKKNKLKRGDNRTTDHVFSLIMEGKEKDEFVDNVLPGLEENRTQKTSGGKRKKRKREDNRTDHVSSLIRGKVLADNVFSVSAENRTENIWKRRKRKLGNSTRMRHNNSGLSLSFFPMI